MDSELFVYEKRVLNELAIQGYHPKVIYDVGASNGVWSDCVAQILPDAVFHLFEPLSDAIPFYREDLQARLARRRGFHLHSIALGDCNDTAVMYVAQDGFGSSLRDRGNIPEVRARVEVPKRRLEDYVAELQLPLPDVIKIDSQGAEDVILSGAGSLLQHAQVLFLETWLKRGYGPNTPLLNEINTMLEGRGFSLVDFGERFYDEKHRLYSVDAFFFAEGLLQTCWLGHEQSHDI